jgi:hypothetical protein
MSGSRKLRVRPAPPPRLVEHGEDGRPSSPDLRLELGDRERPITFMRLNGGDLEPAMRAVNAGAAPTAIITGLAESRETTARARRLASETNTAWLTDPLLFRTGLPGYRTARNLQALDYTPGRDSEPYTPDEFSDSDLARRVGRSVVGAQMDVGASGALGGAFVINAVDDAWLPVNQELLRIEADAAAGWNSPFIGVLPLRMMGFERPEAQRLLIRALAARRPEAWLLQADGLSEDSSAQRIVATLRLALLLQATGALVIVGRAGALRRLFWAFGIGGAEFGLGRLLRFSVPDFTKSGGGPGPVPGPRVEMPSLCSSLPHDLAQWFLEREFVAESECSCPACLRADSPGNDFATTIEHDAHVVVGQAADLAEHAPSARAALLDSELQSAIREWRRIDQTTGRLGSPDRLESQMKALHEGVEAGLLEPARLAAELRLLVDEH